jgi:autophagy-related protein 16
MTLSFKEKFYTQLLERNEQEEHNGRAFISDYNQLTLSYERMKNKLMIQSERTSPTTPQSISSPQSSSADRQKIIDLQSKMLELTRDKAQIMDSMLSLTDHLQVLEKQLDEERNTSNTLLLENERLKQEMQRYKLESDQFIIEIGRRDREIIESDSTISDLKKQLSQLKGVSKFSDVDSHLKIRELELIIEQKTMNHQTQLQNVVSQLQIETKKAQDLEKRLNRLRYSIKVDTVSQKEIASNSGGDIFWGLPINYINHANQSTKQTSNIMSDSTDPLQRKDSFRNHHKQIKYKLQKSFCAHNAGINTIAFSSSGAYIATGSEDKSVKLWDTRMSYTNSLTLLGATDSVMHLQFSKNNQLLLGTSLDCLVRLWDVAKGKLKATLSGHSSKVFGACFVSTNKIMSGSHDKTIKLWDIDGRCIRTFLALSSCNDVESISDDNCVSCHFDSTLRLWDTRKHSSYAHIQSSHQQQITSVSISKDGHYVLTNSKDHTLKIYDLRTNQEVTTLSHTNYICGPSYSKASLCTTDPYNTMAVAISNHKNRSTYLWQLDNKLLPDNVQELDSNTTTANATVEKRSNNSSDVSACAVFSPDGFAVASNVGAHLQIFVQER